jgi:hypothetical protein
MLSLGAGGCASQVSTIPQQPSVDAMATWVKAMDKTVVDRRDSYVKEHADTPYASDIKAGTLAMGMDDDEIFAAGYTCDVKERSAIGSVEACQKETDVYLSEAFHNQEAGTYYVGLDADGKIVSVQNP